MLFVRYTSPKGAVINGIMLKMDNGMIEVAFDSTQEKNFSIAWIRPAKQIGKVTINTVPPTRFNHRALRLIAAGNLDEAREVYRQEEDARKQERIRKEHST